MILLKDEIIKNIENGKIIYTGDYKKNIAINSIDVTISNELKTYTPVKKIKTKFGYMVIKDETITPTLDNYIPQINDIILHMDKPNKVFDITIPEEGLILTPGILYLGSTNEKVGSDYFIPMYEGRSSTGRLGFESHISAGFGDLGFKSNWTLEITVQHPIKIYPNARVGQIYFVKPDKLALLKAKNNGDYYKGKYVNQTEPQQSKMYLDFE